MRYDFVTPSHNMVYDFDPDSILLGYQKRWIADKSSLKIADKGRRTGFTWGEAADAALVASLSRSANGSDHFYTGTNRDMAQEFIQAVAGWAEVYNYATSAIDEGVEDRDGNYFEDKDGNKINTFTIYFESGYRVHSLSSRPSNFRGRQGNVTIDEAAFHEDLSELLKAAIPLMTWGGKIRVISTHDNAMNEFNELIQDALKGNNNYSHHRLTLDDARREGLYKRICQRTGVKWSIEAEDEWVEMLIGSMDIDSVKEEFYCIPKESAGSYIPRHLLDRATREEHHIIRINAPDDFMDLYEIERVRYIDEWLEKELKPLFLERLDPQERHSLGEDFARDGDLTAFTVTAIRTNTTRPQKLIIEVKSMPFNQQEQIMKWIGYNLPRLTGMAFDATGNGQALAEQARIEFGSAMVEEVHLSNKYYDEWMPKYKAGFEDGTIEIPKDEEIIQDHRTIQVINGVAKIDRGRTKSERGGTRHGDTAISGMLSYRASFMEGGLIEFYEVKDPSRSDYDPFYDDDNYMDDSKGAY